MNPLVITFLMVLPLSFAALLLAAPARPASKPTQQRIVAIQDSVRSSTMDKFLSPAILLTQRRVLRLGPFLGSFRFIKRLEELAHQAGTSINIGGLALAAATCSATLGGVACLVSSMLPAIAAAALGVPAPYLWLRFKRSRRLKAFNLALPDAIDLLARALRAGHSVGSAIEMVGEQSPEPLAFEFVQVFQQQRLGLPFRDAAMQMCDRTPSRDLHFLVTAILIQKETGGDLIDILDRTAHVIRERIRIEGEVRTRTAQGRLTGWILAALPAIMLLLINFANPGYSDLLFHDVQGRKLLYLGAGLISVGALIIRKIVDVRV